MSNFLSPPDYIDPIDIIYKAPLEYILMCEAAREVKELDEKMPVSWAEAFAKQLKELQEKIQKEKDDTPRAEPLGD